VAEIPDHVVLKRDRDLEGRSWQIWLRRGLFGLLPLISLLALLNTFGQRPATATTTSDAAQLKIFAPTRVRSGLLFEARFRVTAKRELKKATLILAPGWAEGMTMNTIEPSPVNEASDDGRLSFELGHIRAGGSFLLFLQFQVNPTNVAWRRDQSVELDDGGTKLLEIHRKVTVFP
jgi:hypothetical protein